MIGHAGFSFWRRAAALLRAARRSGDATGYGRCGKARRGTRVLRTIAPHANAGAVEAFGANCRRVRAMAMTSCESRRPGGPGRRCRSPRWNPCRQARPPAPMHVEIAATIAPRAEPPRLLSTGSTQNAEIPDALTTLEPIPLPQSPGIRYSDTVASIRRHHQFIQALMYRCALGDL